MPKINEEMLSFFIAKNLGYMTQDMQKEVELTDQGFVYKGELILSHPCLRDKIIIKETVKVGDLIKKKEETSVFIAKELDLPIQKIKVSGPAVDALAERKESDDAKPFGVKDEPVVEAPVVVENPVQTYPGKRRGPKPKNK